MFKIAKQNNKNNALSCGHAFIVLIAYLFSSMSNAQCAMCRAAVESEGNGVKTEAINDGIVYLMIIPYLLAAGIGYAVYRIYKNKKA